MGVAGPTIDDCVKMAWEALHALFRDKICDLTDKFPADATDSKGRRMPDPCCRPCHQTADFSGEMIALQQVSHSGQATSAFQRLQSSTQPMNST